MADAEAGRLYGLPLDEFTAARDARARELRQDGEREKAAEVAALRKPVLAAWVVNMLARDERADVRELVEGLAWAGPSAGGRSRVLRPGDVPRSPLPSLHIPYSWTQLSLTPILPDGQMAVAPPCPTCP